MVDLYTMFKSPAFLQRFIGKGCKGFGIIFVLSLVDIRHGVVYAANLHTFRCIAADHGKPAAFHFYQNRFAGSGLFAHPNVAIDNADLVGYLLRLIPFILQFKPNLPGLYLIRGYSL